jgi:signal recognition particle receptor subunit beta
VAVLDTSANEIVIRVVYDGPPRAGKTTSLRALAGSLATSAITPQEDHEGRTLWFDWMEYTGGRYEGCRIKCQIVSVPGQPALAARRRMLLDGADVIVCVADSAPAEWDRSATHLANVCREVSVGDPAPGVILQANKRDVSGAVSIEEVRERLERERLTVGVVESVAADGTGIREAFVYAVRLALDRVRELMNRHALPEAGELETSDRLLARMRRREDEAAAVTAAATVPPSGTRASAAKAVVQPPPVVVIENREDSVAAVLLREVLAQEHAASRGSGNGYGHGNGHGYGHVQVPHGAGVVAPRPPDTSVPSGAIWPPVEGRAIMYEVAQSPLTPKQLASGDWVAGLGSGWRVVSSREAVFASLDQGRAALIQWARLHAASLPVISPRRCIVLADAGDGSWRLWQIVHAEDSLRDNVAAALREPTPELVLYKLCQVAQLLLEADRKLAETPCSLQCSIDSVGVADHAAVYIGLMPEVGTAREPDPMRASAPVLLRTQLGPLVLDLADRHHDLHDVLSRVPRRFVHSDTILATLAGILGTQHAS